MPACRREQCCPLCLILAKPAAHEGTEFMVLDVSDGSSLASYEGATTFFTGFRWVLVALGWLGAASSRW